MTDVMGSGDVAEAPEAPEVSQEAVAASEAPVAPEAQPEATEAPAESEADKMTNLRGDIQRVLDMLGRNATVREVVGFLKGLVERHDQ